MDTQSSFTDLTALPNIHQNPEVGRAHQGIGVVKTVDVEHAAARKYSTAQIMDLQNPWMER
jgi:hypothetical protein